MDNSQKKEKRRREKEERMRQLVILTDSSRNPVIVCNRLDYPGYGTVLYAWAKRLSSSYYRSELRVWFWRQILQFDYVLYRSRMLRQQLQSNV